MVIVLINFVAVLALWRAYCVLRHCRQDDMHQLDIQRAHQERQQSGIHSRAFATLIICELAKELVSKLFDNRLEDWLSHAYDTHENARSNA